MISIIIPVWNHAAEALACLRSLERQTEKDFEVILVDDGSTDGVEEKLNDAHPSFPFQFVRFDQNRGAPVARNEGFRRSRGELVLFLDADVTLKSDALERMRTLLIAAHSASFVYASFYFGWKKFSSQAFDPNVLRQRNYIHTSSLMRRSAFPGFDESLKKFQDWDLWITMTEQGKRGVWIDDVLFTVKPHGRLGMSAWLPRFFYRLPWIEKVSPTVRRYRAAEAILRHKHSL